MTNKQILKTIPKSIVELTLSEFKKKYPNEDNITLFEITADFFNEFNSQLNMGSEEVSPIEPKYSNHAYIVSVFKKLQEQFPDYDERYLLELTFKEIEKEDFTEDSLNKGEKELAFVCRFLTGYNNKKCKECDYKDYCRRETIKNYGSISEYNKANEGDFAEDNFMDLMEWVRKHINPSEDEVLPISFAIINSQKTKKKSKEEAKKKPEEKRSAMERYIEAKQKGYIKTKKPKSKEEKEQEWTETWETISDEFDKRRKARKQLKQTKQNEPTQTNI